MYHKQQFEQLILQYTEIKAGSETIKNLIANEQFDEAIDKIKTRENVLLNCKCIRNLLDLDEEQEKQLNDLLDDIRALEQENIKTLEESIEQVSQELRVTRQNQKIVRAYDSNENENGNIINTTDAN